MRADADRAEMQARKERGELIEAASIINQGEAIGRVIRAHLDALANNLPPALAGRPAKEISRIIKAEFRRALNDMHDRESQYFQPIES